jgi:anti-sigma B factor antagonist
MQVEQRTLDNNIELLAVSGRVAVGRESQRFEWTVDELLKQHKNRIVVDVSQVDYVDSAGLGILVGCHGKARESGGELRVAGAIARVSRLLEMTGLDKVLLLHPSVDDAVNAMAAGKGQAE